MKHADVMISDSTQRAGTIVAALALAISNLAQLPSSEVDNPASYFNLQLLPNINKIISEWNENMVIDAKACVEQTRIFWQLRYTAAYPMSRPIYSFDYGFFDTVFGVNTLVSSELKDFLNDNKNQVLALSIVAAEIIVATEA